MPELPPQEVVTGDKEIDTLLWLRQVIGTGDPVLIAQAKEAAKRITTPPGELEQRYGKWLVAKAGHMLAGLGSIGFANLDGLAERAITRRANEAEAIERFGDALWDDTQAEAFCREMLRGLEKDSWQLPPEQVAVRFKVVPELMPHTLSDCLHELAYSAAPCVRHPRLLREQHRGAYPRLVVFGLLAELRPRSREEARATLRYLMDSERDDTPEVERILDNLIG